MCGLGWFLFQTRSDNDALRAQLTRLEGEHAEALKQRDEQLQRALENQAAKHQQAIDTINAEHDKAVAAMRQGERSRLAAAAKEFENIFEGNKATLGYLNSLEDKVKAGQAPCTSPFSSIAQKVFGVQKVYQQDLIYPKGINGNKIGGYAHETTLPSNSVDAITLHCSLEHFEGDTDKLFFAEVNRILKTGGKAVILPFYFAHSYTIHIDPAFNLLRNHHPIIDAEPDLHYCNWYQYHSRHYDVMQVQKRIASQMPDCSIKLFRVDNFREVWDKSYLRWILEITKN